MRVSLAEEWTDGCVGEWTTLEKPKVAAPAMSLKEIVELDLKFLKRFVDCTPAQALVLVYWSLATWFLDAFDYVPYLHLCSPQKRCGKTTVLRCLGWLVCKPYKTSSCSAAALYRTIEKERPTVLCDEMDGTWSSSSAGSEKGEALRTIFNSGNEHDAVVSICVGQSHEPTKFKLFGFKALASIGMLPETIADRCFAIYLSRKSKASKTERAFIKRIRRAAPPTSEAKAAWAADQNFMKELADADPQISEAMEHGMNDREIDGAMALLAVADAAGERERLRAALLEISSGAIEDDDAAIQLHKDIREAFRTSGFDKLTNAQLTHEMRTNEAASVIHANDDAGNIKHAQWRARKLKLFMIKPAVWKDEQDKTVRGYKKEQFTETWTKYLPPPEGETC